MDKPNSVAGIYSSLRANRREIAALSGAHCSAALVRKLERLPSFAEHDSFMRERIDRLALDAAALCKLCWREELPPTKEDFCEILGQIESHLIANREFRQTERRQYENELLRMKLEQPSGCQKIFLKSKEAGPNRDSSMKDSFESLGRLLDEAFGLD